MSKAMYLRPFKIEDASDVAKNANNLRVAQYLPEIFPSPYTLDAAEWWVSEGHEIGNVFNRAIIAGGECVGSIGVNFLDCEYQYTAKLGYWLGEPHWGKGIMTKALTEFSSQVFAEFKLKRLYAPVVHSNMASIGALQKAGFVREGVFKNNVYLRGIFYDECIYAKYS